MTELSLPPRPDRNGDPLPPRAPRFDGDDSPNNGRPPPPLWGDHPALAWDRDHPLGGVLALVVVLALLVGGMSLFTAMDGNGWFDWMHWWPMWVLIGGVAVAAASPLSITTRAAGADWFNRDIERFGVFRVRETTVRLYELTRINLNISGAMRLQLQDERYALEMEITEWQRTRLMWDLVYNGIVHSVANGAKINDRAWKYLWLDEIEGLAEAAGRSKA